MQKIVCIIPARLESSRFPGKLLEKINGKTILEITWNSACKAKIFDYISFATDSDQIAKTVESFGANWIKTSKNCQNGTERLIEIFKLKKIISDIWINWQADEPFLSKLCVKELLQTCNKNYAKIWTLASKIVSKDEISSPNTVKVVFNSRNKALYFSRLPIPFTKPAEDGIHFKHIGIYAYSSKSLEKMCAIKQCRLEKLEGLEQLRYLHNGFSIKVFETMENSLGINVKKDLELMRKMKINNSATAN